MKLVATICLGLAVAGVAVAAPKDGAKGSLL